MTVTTADFEAMTPVPYSQARPELCTGDILLFHSTGLGSLATEYFTHSLWCHAAFVWCLPEVGRVMLLESMDKIGVRVMPMSTRINGCAAFPAPYPGRLMLARSENFPKPPDPTKVTAMTQFALDRVGFPYSNAELQAIMLRIIEGMAGLQVSGRLNPKNEFICSEYVAKCYDAMGVELVPDKLGYIAPADLANDASVRGVFSLVPG